MVSCRISHLQEAIEVRNDGRSPHVHVGHFVERFIFNATISSQFSSDCSIW